MQVLADIIANNGLIDILMENNSNRICENTLDMPLRATGDKET